MRVYKKCFWCGKHYIEPDLIDVAIDVITENKKLPKNKQKNTVDEYTNKKITLTCGFCGNIPYPNFRSFDDAIKYAYGLYNEYVKFMDGIAMPKEILIVWEEKPSYNGVCRYDDKLRKFVVGLDITNIIYFSNLKKLLFHEFTHIRDFYDSLTGAKRIGSELEHWYSEYHATEVELMGALGFKNVNDRKRIRLSSMIIDDNKAVTLKDYLYSYLNENSKGLIKYCNKNVLALEDIAVITKNLMYFRGKLNFCKKYMSKEDFEKIVIKGNELELLVKDKLSGNNDVFAKLLDIMDIHLLGSLNDIDPKFIDKIMLKVYEFLCVNNVKEYEILKSEFNLRLRVFLDLIEIENKKGGVSNGCQ